MKSVTIEVGDVLKTYNDEAKKKANEIAKEVSKKAVKELKETSPKKTGNYASGWKSKKNREGGYVVYNSKRPQLTHLLEHGHAKVNGKGRVSAVVHIAPVEASAIAEFERRVKEEL